MCKAADGPSPLTGQEPPPAVAAGISEPDASHLRQAASATIARLPVRYWRDVGVALSRFFLGCP